MTRRVLAPVVAMILTLLGITAAAAPVLASVPRGSATGGNFVPFFNASLQASPVYGQVFRPGFLLSPILATNLLQSVAKVNSTGDVIGRGSIVDPGPIGGFPALLPLALGNTLPAIPWPGWPLTASASYPSVPTQSVGIGGIPSGFLTDKCGLDGNSAAEAGLLFAGAVTTQSNACAAGYLASSSTPGKLFSFDHATATSVARTDPDGTMSGTSTSTIGGLQIGGIVTIGGLTAATTVNTTPSHAYSHSSVHLSDVSALGGWQAQIDRTGVHLTGLPVKGPAPSMTLQQAQKALNSTLKLLHLSIRLLGATHGKAPADSTTAATSEAAGLQITAQVNLPVTFPSIPKSPIAIPLGGGTPDIMTLTLGHTSGSATAGGTNLGGSGDGSLPGSSGVGTASGGGSIGSTPPSASLPPTSALPPGPSSVSNPASGSAPVTAPSGPTATVSQPSALSTPVLSGSMHKAFGWVMALGLIGALFLGYQIWSRSAILTALLSPWREVRR